MNPARLLSIARKEVVQILRDPRSLAIVVIMPAILVLLFGYGVSLDLKQLPICVLDRESSQQSQDLIHRFAASPYFVVTEVVRDDTAAAKALDSGRVRMAIVIPWDFAKRLGDGRPVSVQALVDASDDNTARVLMGYAEAVVQTYSAQMQLEWLNRQGIAMSLGGLNIQTRTWYNEDLESSAFIIPGVLALVMSVIGAFLTSLTVAREWERGTMEQLISTPVTAFEIMLGKLVPYFILGMLDTAISAFVAIFWFCVPFRGSYLSLFLCSALFLVVVLSMGFLISVVAKGQFAASQIALLVTFLPAFLLSGFLFSIEQMPVALQWITRVIPARYYVSLLRKIFLKGSPASLLMVDLIPLAIITMLLALRATRSFHKRLE
jgi:ABC-2 type transport system permease protein